MMNIPLDKLLHVLVGISVVAVTYPFGLWFAIVSVILIGVGKEYWDSLGYGTTDTLDALATILGGIGLIAWYSVIGLIKII